MTRRLLYALALCSTASVALAAPVDFAHDVKPILAKYCYDCHGADKQKNSLRLDLKAHAFKGGEDHGSPIKPGDGKNSVLVKFVSGEDEENIMPPKGKRLTPDEVAKLSAWIDQGASWPDDGVAVNDPLQTHWAYQPIKADVGGSIDTFIKAKLAEKGLHMSAPADARTLCRRLYFDVIGLPPTPEQLEEFVKETEDSKTKDIRQEDKGQDSGLLSSVSKSSVYEKLVDALLASPRYGERWARHWLDVVRFAESDGFETNKHRPNAWPYRDYVINAFNNDTPFDQFVIDQLAGDATGADAATGFIVGGTTDIVKSPDPILTAQQRADELNDMITATGTAFLGLTVNCARCHNHKFDPISSDDYYGIAACFSGVRHGERALKQKDDAARETKAAALREKLAALDSRVREFEPISALGRTVIIPPDDQAHTAALKQANTKRTTYEDGSARGETGFAGDAANLPTLGDGYWVWIKEAEGDVFSWLPKSAGKFRVWVSWGSGFKSHDEDARYVLDLDGDLATKDDQTEIGSADHRKFADGSGKMPNRKLWSGFKDLGIHEFREGSRLILRRGGNEGYPTADMLVLQEELGNAKPVQPRLRVPVQRGTNTERFAATEARFVRFTINATTQMEPCIDELEIFTSGANPRNVALASLGAKATSSGDYPDNPYHKLAHLNDGRYGNERSWISNERGKGWVTIELPKTESIDRVVWSRDRDNVPRYNDRTATAYRIETSKDGREWKTVATAQDRLPIGRKLAVPIYSSEGIPAGEAARLKEMLVQRTKLNDELTAATSAPMVYAGKFVEPSEMRKLRRGDVSQPAEVVPPSVLAKIGPRVSLNNATTDQERRLALAKWITDAANPLTARVIVNRLWHYHFGTGIVDTPSDFGVNGGKPTHPELLDWLANELITSGWSLKHVQRLILLSATFQQSSSLNHSDPKSAIQDPQSVDAGDRLLWHFPAQRLQAEALRDTMLAVSGKLDLKMGGPGFDLFEPNTNYVKVYTSKTSFGPPEFRRMVYQSKPRVQLDDTFGIFDCPDAGQTAPKRTVSTTPLQALSLLNSTFAVQQAEFFAERLKQECGDDPARQTRRAFMLAFGRDATADEISDGTKLAKQFGLSVLCRAMMNANEFVQVR